MSSFQFSVGRDGAQIAGMTKRELRRISNRRWYAIGGVFIEPYWFGEPPQFNCQTLMALDVESDKGLGAWVANRPTAPFSAAEWIKFVDEISTKYGPPTVGILISDSAWKSTHEMSNDPALQQRVSRLIAFGFSWEETAADERLRFALHFQSRGLRVEWEDTAVLEDLERQASAKHGRKPR